MRNPENRIRNPKTQNRNPGFRVLARKAYSHLHREKPKSETRKPKQKPGNNPKSGNYFRTKTLQTLASKGVSEKPRNPECVWNFFKNPKSTELVFIYLQGRNPETQYLPLHYMEGMRYPPCVEWRYRFYVFHILHFFNNEI